MIDIKTMWLRQYEMLIEERDRAATDKTRDAFVVHGPMAIKSMEPLHQSLTSPEAYTAFVLYCAYAKKTQYAVKPNLSDVANDMADTIAEVGTVNPYQFVDAQ